MSGNGTSNPTDKKRLINACVPTVASPSVLDSTASANANQLNKRVSLHEWAKTAAQEATRVAGSVSTLVVTLLAKPVVRQPPPFRNLARLADISFTRRCPAVGAVDHGVKPRLNVALIIAHSYARRLPHWQHVAVSLRG